MLLAGNILIGVGAIFCFLGVLFLILRKKTWRCTEKTEGKIVDMCVNAYRYNNGVSELGIHVKIGGSQIGNRYPVYSYYVNGREYRRANSVSFDMGSVRRMINKTVDVYYNPEKPEQSNMGTVNAFLLIGTIFTCLGIFLSLLGIVFCVIGS